MPRLLKSALVLAVVASAVTAAALGATSTPIVVSKVVDVSRDQTSQNETPLAVNPANPAIMVTGNNDWNYNDGCGVNVTVDGGKTWTPTLPNGFLPGVTKFTNDPDVPGTGAYDAGGDPTVAFSPDGKTAYFVCQAFNFSSPYEIALLLNRGKVTPSGITWQQSGLTRVSTYKGNGISKGSTGQFPDHEDIHVDTSPTSPYKGTIYVTWAQFNGLKGTHSPVTVAVSRDGGRSFTVAKATSGSVRNNQDQRIVTDPSGNAYLTFDNGVQGGKGTVLYISKSSDGGTTWSTPLQFASFQNPVCVFPPYCFNISGGQFRAGGSYPAPAFDPIRNRLDVVFPDIRGAYAQIYFTSAPAGDLTKWTAPQAVAPAAGDRFENELDVAPNGRVDLAFYDRSYSGNKLVDVTYATSADGGSTWRTTRVSTAGFDPSQWGVPSNSAPFRPFIGDYNGIVSTNDSAGLVWTGVAKPAPFNLEVDYATVTP
jgi:hypothetical protein